jgi:adenosylcobinamide-GDP ribazoletransferase
LEKNDGECIMKNIILGLKFSFSYFTILPISLQQDDDISNPLTTKTIIFSFGLVGLSLGLLTVLLLQFINILSYPSYIIASVFYMVSYGFLHTEAICDVADALGAKHKGKDPYDILKQSTIGAFGLFYGVSFLILKISLLSYLLYLDYWFLFLMVVMYSKVIAMINIKLFNWHKNSFFLQTLKQQNQNKLIIFMLIFYLTIGFFLNSDLFLILGFYIFGISFMILKILDKKLGFLNGDTVGVSLEIAELFGFAFSILLV